MKKISTMLFVSLLILFGTIINTFGQNNTLNKFEELNEFPENTIERFAKVKSIQNGTSFDFELLKAKEEEKNILRSYDEEIRYITKGSSARGLVVNVETSGRMNLQVIVYSEARCLVNRVSRRVTRVEDFGNPYISVRGAYRASFENGGYNINRLSDTKARFSATGEFYITYPTITVGGDIVSIAGDNVGVTNPMTISTSIDWD